MGVLLGERPPIRTVTPGRTHSAIRVGATGRPEDARFAGTAVKVHRASPPFWWRRTVHLVRIVPMHEALSRSFCCFWLTPLCYVWLIRRGDWPFGLRRFHSFIFCIPVVQAVPVHPCYLRVYLAYLRIVARLIFERCAIKRSLVTSLTAVVFV